MWWNYAWVFAGAFLLDVFPVPLPPAFTLMIFFQIYFKLDIWWVICIGVCGSILGRYILSLYIPHLSGKIFKQSKNEDIRFLGNKMKEKGWKGPALILVYSLMPLPTTPLFIAGGMARMKPIYILPPFIIGKFISDMVTVLMGKYAAENTNELLKGLVSFKSIAGLVLGLGLIFLLLFIDWHTVLKHKKVVFKFKIWK